jgi:RND family efflux transporter MFP subunit
VDGVVTRVGAQVGQPADQASSAFEISDLSRLWLSANVDEVDVDRVFIGLPAEVRLDALPGEDFGATVQQMALLPVVVNGVVNYPARFRIESDDDRLRAGMTAEVRVVIDQRSNVLSVPNEYIIQEGDRASVTRLSPTGEAMPVEVVTGLRGDTHTEIISGLREGDQLIVGSAALVTEGQ